MIKKNNTSVVILSAGFSSRMKQAKFSLLFEKNRTFLEKIVGEYLTFGCEEIIVVMNPDGINIKNTLNLNFPDIVKFVLNKFPERERFFSLQTGLKALKKNNCCFCCFIQNSDNPFVNQELLTVLYEKRNEAEYIVPAYKEKGGHPIMINKNIIKQLSSEKNIHSNLKEYLKRFLIYRLKVDDKNILLNINDENIYKKLF
ncbi:MAG: NTP transferase domain-containing protein [Bacteroidales bacterium]|nr:NTP transferase domain-containing protein [Bacteroidales bacterium]